MAYIIAHLQFTIRKALLPKGVLAVKSIKTTIPLDKSAKIGSLTRRLECHAFVSETGDFSRCIRFWRIDMNRIMRSIGVAFFLLMLLLVGVKTNIYADANQPAQPSDSNVTNIISGTAAEIGEFPFVGRLSNNENDCDVFLITADWGVTAAHCLPEKKPTYFFAQFGSVSLYSSTLTTQRRNVIEAIPSPHYNSTQLDADLALVRFSSPFTLNEFVHVVALPSHGEEIRLENAGHAAQVVGWGKTSLDSGQSTRLLKGSTEVTDRAECERLYAGIISITGKMICSQPVQAGFSTPCQGDSGGPLLVRDHLNRVKAIGVVSFSSDCSVGNYPSVYARVSAFLDFINEHVGEIPPQPMFPAEFGLDWSLQRDFSYVEEDDVVTATLAMTNSTAVTMSTSFRITPFGLHPMLIETRTFTISPLSTITSTLRFTVEVPLAVLSIVGDNELKVIFFRPIPPINVWPRLAGYRGSEVLQIFSDSQITQAYTMSFTLQNATPMTISLADECYLEGQYVFHCVATPEIRVIEIPLRIENYDQEVVLQTEEGLVLKRKFEYQLLLPIVAR